MEKIIVQFSNADAAQVIAYLASAQDADAYPNQGEVDVSDPRWKDYYDAQAPYIQSLLPSPT
jgi:hypothetical protein